MIAEVLLVLAGHQSSLFPKDHTIHPAFDALLHPGEKQCLEALGLIAFRYRKIKAACATLSLSPSRYLCALCSTLNQILKDEYEVLVVETETKVLQRDCEFVAGGSFVPLSSVRAAFAEWDAPMAALESLLVILQEEKSKMAGHLIDMLLTRSATGTHRIASIMARLSVAVQRVWRTQLISFLVHGTLSVVDPIASNEYVIDDGYIPSCVSTQTRNSIAYIGRALATVKAANWQTQFPRDLASDHTKRLDSILVQDQYGFDRVIADIRTNVSEWLWLNVLTEKDVEEAVVSLANYFLLRNGEFSLSLIHEIERLLVSRLTARSGPSTMIREQDLHLALLRASLGTTAQQDPSLARLRFHLPSGPLRPLLPSLKKPKSLTASLGSNGFEETTFDDLLLGTSLSLSYSVEWPLDLFLQPNDLKLYGMLFSYISSLRKTHTRVHTCWTSLSNAQRARRRWTGLGEGGTVDDLEVRERLLRCGWGVVRQMSWLLDNLLSYVMTDVVDSEFTRLKKLVARPQGQDSPSNRRRASSAVQHPPSPCSHPTDGHGSNDRISNDAAPLDFTSLRNIHSNYLERLLVGSLLANPALTGIIRSLFELCEQFVAQVERWGGDVLPALLFEGSLAKGAENVGEMVKERWATVSEINETFNALLESFYEQLVLSTSQQHLSGRGDASKSVLLNSTVNASVFAHTRTFIRTRDGRKLEGDGEARRHLERLLLRLDFNGEFTKVKPLKGEGSAEDILRQGGLA